MTTRLTPDETAVCLVHGTAQCAHDRLTPDEMRAWLDRKPPQCRECGGIGGHTGHCMSSRVRAWRDWYTVEVDEDVRMLMPGEYLGERSARTGPDDVQTAQRCGCVQCRGELGDK